MYCAVTDCLHAVNRENDLCRCHSDVNVIGFQDKPRCWTQMPSGLAEELEQELYNLMNQYHYNSQGSDYSCAFCREAGAPNPQQTITHKNCLGEKLQDFFRKNNG